MLLNPSPALRVAYCLVVLGAVLPLGLQSSPWVAMATGPGFGSTVPFLGPVLLLVLGVFRVCLVARHQTTLASPPVSGVSKLMRAAGILGIYVGAVTTLVGWVAGPLMRSLMTTRSQSGVEFFVVGLWLSVVAGVALLGLLLLEFSRLIAYERLALRHQTTHKSKPQGAGASEA